MAESKENNELSSEENDWIKETTDKIYSILKDTPPDGEEFLAVAKNMIMREDVWSSWKNEGCPALKKVSQENELTRHPRIEDNLGQRSFSILTAQATTGADTIFVPSKTGPPQAMSLKHTFDEYITALTPAPELKDFLAEAIEESERKMEPEKKKVADPSFAWLSVKLISLKAPTFFSNSHSAVPGMSEYVDIMCKKIYRDLNPGLLLPPIMPAPKSAAIKTKKPGTKAPSTANSLATSLKKRIKKPKVGECDKTVVKVVKGGVVKLIKTAKGLKVVKDDEAESLSQSEPTKNGTSSPQEKPDDIKTNEKPKLDKEKVTSNNTSKVIVKNSNTVSNDKTVIKKIDKPLEKAIEKSPDNNFVKPANPTKSEKHKLEKQDKSDKVSKSPSPKPQRKSEEKIRKEEKKDDKRVEKREDKKIDKRDDRRDRADSRSRERSIESRREKSSDRTNDKVKTIVKSPGKRKASPKRDDHKSNKVIRGKSWR